jgi:hypothetical protein
MYNFADEPYDANTITVSVTVLLGVPEVIQSVFYFEENTLRLLSPDCSKKV